MWQQSLIIIAVAVGSYFFGNISVAGIVALANKKKISDLGSGNPGTMNVIRSIGKKAAGFVLFFDIVKGVIPAVVGWAVVGAVGFGSPSLTHGIFFISGARLGLYVAGVGVVLGHIFPVVRKFKGGKGIATSIGVLVVAQPIIAPIFFFAGAMFLLVTKMGSITSFICIAMPIAIEGFVSGMQFSDGLLSMGNLVAGSILLFVLFSLTIIAHYKNVGKLFLGTERETNIGQGKRKKKKNAVH